MNAGVTVGEVVPAAADQPAVDLVRDDLNVPDQALTVRAPRPSCGTGPADRRWTGCLFLAGTAGHTLRQISSSRPGLTRSAWMPLLSWPEVRRYRAVSYQGAPAGGPPG